MTTLDRPPVALVVERYEPVIGIEVHCQLRTASKMFCACSTAYDGAPPNSHTCPVCLGLPGSLPVINRAAVEHVLATGLALGATIPTATRWDRKNYFYPDLPKGYQISQYDLPLASNGLLAFETSRGPVTVRIRRAHLEEDTAKLVHGTTTEGHTVSLVDFNRSGMPLMEIVTEPDVRSAEEARRYAETLQQLLRYIGASTAEMESGQMRVEANVSLRPAGSEVLGTRVEIKNMNSFRSVERAIEHELVRQAAALDDGQTLRQETRGWDDGRGSTYVMRVKEDSDDYRYFPEPDLPPLVTDPAWLAAISARLPELPAARRSRYMTAWGLSAYDAGVITSSREFADYFESAVQAGSAAGAGELAAPAIPPKAIANWVTGELARLLNLHAGTPRGNVERSPVAPGGLVELIRLVAAGEISATNAKEALAAAFETGEPPVAIVAARGYRQISDADTLGRLVDEVVAANPAAVADFHAGKSQALGFLVGQVMKASHGQANAGMAGAALRERLDRQAGPPGETR